MRKHIKLLFILFLSFIYPSLAQEEKLKINPKNTVYLEVLGNAYLYSLNYERVFLDKESYSLSGRIGFSYFKWSFFGDSHYSFFPLSINFIKHFNKNNVEIGVGAVNQYSFYNNEESEYLFIPSFHVNYRRYISNNMDFRAGLTLSRANLNADDKYEIFPWPFISLGKRF